MWLEELPAGVRAKVRPARPVWVRPMLAKLHEGPLPPGDWLFEHKFDGQRIAVVCDPAAQNGVRMFTRSGSEVASRYPDVTQGLPQERPYVLDGELVAFEEGQESFALLQKRMHRREPELDVPVHFLAFDVLHLDGQDVTALPLRHRVPLLQEIGLRGRAAVVPRTTGDPVKLLHRACELGWEGLIAKNADAPYVARRSGHWLKLKCLRHVEVRIGGYTSPKGSRQGFGALLVGETTGEGLRYRGKVGTGFNAKELRLLHDALLRLRRMSPPFLDPPTEAASWVEPVLVCRVGYKEQTSDGRLRHPRFAGLLSPGLRRTVP